MDHANSEDRSRQGSNLDRKDDHGSDLGRKPAIEWAGFIFKGGTSLTLLLGEPSRFSIDNDIVLAKSQNLLSFFESVVDQGVFSAINSLGLRIPDDI